MLEAGFNLVEARDEDFDWMLQARDATHRGLHLPPGGVDEPFVLDIVRSIARQLRASGCTGSWMMVAGDEVVGLCGYRRAPSPDGEVEIGYGVAAQRRGRGLATLAVRYMTSLARNDGVRALTAETATSNIASQRVLERNGFERSGDRVDPDDGPVWRWRREL